MGGEARSCRTFGLKIKNHGFTWNERTGRERMAKCGSG